MSEKEQREKELWKRLVSWMQTKGFDASQLCVEPRTREGMKTRTPTPEHVPVLTCSIQEREEDSLSLAL